jgi:hypothetical protein
VVLFALAAELTRAATEEDWCTSDEKRHACTALTDAVGALNVRTPTPNAQVELFLIISLPMIGFSQIDFNDGASLI